MRKCGQKLYIEVVMYHISNLRPKNSCSSLRLVKYFLEKRFFLIFECLPWRKILINLKMFLSVCCLTIAYPNCLQYEHAIVLDFNSTTECFLFLQTLFLQLFFFVVSLFIAILQIIWKYKKYLAIFHMSQKLKNVFQRIFRVANK